MTNSINIQGDVLELLLKGVDSDDRTFLEEAAVTINPMVTWAKFVLTDDLPNKNKVRVPETEFDNIIKSGVFMPIKMAAEEIKEDHDESVPIGVITHLKKVKNQIIGLAAFWNKERPNDVGLLKKMFASNEQINLSWEIAYEQDREVDDGIRELEGTALRAATIVGLPAYAGRTPILEMASENNTEDKNIVEELEKLQNDIKVVTEERDNLKTQLDELKSSVSDLESLRQEVETLREFKASIDAENEKKEKLASIKNMFVEAGLQKDDEYFDSNAEKLLTLSEDSLSFMVQELVAFSSRIEESNEEASQKPKIPNFTSGDLGDELPLAELAKELRKSLTRKE